MIMVIAICMSIKEPICELKSLTYIPTYLFCDGRYLINGIELNGAVFGLSIEIGLIEKSGIINIHKHLIKNNII